MKGQGRGGENADNVVFSVTSPQMVLFTLGKDQTVQFPEVGIPVVRCTENFYCLCLRMSRTNRTYAHGNSLTHRKYQTCIFCRPTATQFNLHNR